MCLKLNKLILNEQVENKIVELVETEMNKENVVIFYQLVTLFNLNKFQQQLRSKVHITYYLVTIRATFLELNYKSVVKILDNSELEIIQHLGVRDAINIWVQYKSEERSKYEMKFFKKLFRLRKVEGISHIARRKSFFNWINK